MGRYFSAQYVRNKVLKQSETEIKEMDKQIKKEISAGILPDPNAPIDPNTGLPIDPNAQGEMDLGAPVNEPDLAKQEKAVEAPEGGEI